MSTERILAYIRRRQDQEAANATINRELSALKRMFRLGEKAGRVVRRPYIDMLQERNARTGFFERKEFDAVLAHLPDDLAAVFEVAYITGWRVNKEGAVKLQTFTTLNRVRRPMWFRSWTWVER